MKRIIVIACLFLSLPVLSFAQEQFPSSFADLLTRAKMSLTVPEGYAETDVVKNPHMSYDYAVKHPEIMFEIRYTVRPMDVQLQDYEKFTKEGATMVHPNNWFPGVALTTFHNIGGVDNSYGPFDEDAVKSEFNADSGVTGACDPRKEFADGYRCCVMISIFKRDVGTAFIFFMANDPNALMENMVSNFHNLKFE